MVVGQWGYLALGIGEEVSVGVEETRKQNVVTVHFHAFQLPPHPSRLACLWKEEKDEGGK